MPQNKAINHNQMNIIKEESKAMARESSPTFKHSTIAKPSSPMNLLLSSGRKGNATPSVRRKLKLGCGSPKAAKVAIAPESEDDDVWVSGDYDSLPEVDIFYPIERTSTIVECCDPCEISRRITSCLQKLSIAAKYNPSDVSCQ